MLITAPSLPNPDDAYASLLAAHEGLTEDESHAFNARLILILMNHIGNPETLKEALELAKETGQKG